MKEHRTKLKDTNEAMLENLGEMIDLALTIRDKCSEGITKADEFYEFALESICGVTDIQEMDDIREKASDIKRIAQSVDVVRDDDATILEKLTEIVTLALDIQFSSVRLAR